jgi:hypothetical protein
MKIVICGSMAFSKEMTGAGKTLRKYGHEIILPRNCENYAECRLQTENNSESTRHKIEHNLLRGYFEKIKGADAILAVNCDKDGIKNYIGGNTFLEMGFAHVLNKKIFLLNNIPEIGYKDEIMAMQPTILNGDLEKIK